MKKEAVKMKIGARTLQLTNLDKILFPKSKITKKDLIEYYHKIAPKMLPLIKDRPISMLRYPQGIKAEGFFQKNISDFFPTWIKTKKVKREGKEGIDMVVCNDVATLIFLANLACITPHIWLSRIDKLNYPDRLIFDLDPPSKEKFPLVIEAAYELKNFLEKDLKLTAFVMTTGSKGLHVVVPIKRELPFSEVRAIARTIANLLVSQKPDKYTTETRISKRRGRVFIDYLRNSFTQTAVAPYAVRALEGAPVATPLHWSELKKGLTSQSFNIKNVLKRLKKNPWKNMERSIKSLKNKQTLLHEFLSNTP